MTADQLEVYRAALKAARAAFDAGKDRLDRLEIDTVFTKEEMSRLRRTITALSAMCSEAPFSDSFGITDSCMSVMETAKTAMTTGDIVEALEGIGFDLASQKNASASVHSVLTRLAAKNKIEKVQDADGNVRWRGPQYDPNYIDLPF